MANYSRQVVTTPTKKRGQQTPSTHSHDERSANRKHITGPTIANRSHSGRRRRRTGHLLQSEASPAELRQALDFCPSRPQRYAKFSRNREQGLVESFATPRASEVVHTPHASSPLASEQNVEEDIPGEPRKVDVPDERALHRVWKPFFFQEAVISDNKHQHEESEEHTYLQEEALDDIDRELLRLDPYDILLSTTARPQQIRISPRSPISKRVCDFDRGSPGLEDIQNQFEDGDDEEAEQPVLKKQRLSPKSAKGEVRDALLRRFFQARTGSKSANKSTRDNNEEKNEDKDEEVIPPPEKRNHKKKQVRRIPVDELVLVSERLRAPDSEDEEDRDPNELAEDPISEHPHIIQKSNRDTESHRVHLPPGRAWFIDPSQFRMPTIMPPQPGQWQVYSHSDGFEGHEADTIGRVMPIRQNRRHETPSRLTQHMNELTLVSERRQDPIIKCNPKQKKMNDRKHAKPKSLAVSQEHEVEDMCRGESMILDVPSEEYVPGLAVPLVIKEALLTPYTRLTYRASSETPTRTTSPLKPTSRPEGRVEFEDENSSRKKLSPKAERYTVSDLLNGADTFNERSAKTKKNLELAISQELMMVTIQRPTNFGDDDDEQSNDEEDQEEESDLEETFVDEEQNKLPFDPTPNEELGYPFYKADVQEVQYAKAPEDQLMLDAEDAEEMQLPVITSGPDSQHPDSSWRPQVLGARTVVMGVEEDIFDSPAVREIRKQDRSSFHSARRYLWRGSQSLTVVSSRKSSPAADGGAFVQDSQGSTELGDSQKFVRRSLSSSTPETQFQDFEERSSQLSCVEQDSYFDRASQQLSQPVGKLNLQRAKSMPIKQFLDQGASPLMPLSDVFENTISPVRSSSRLPILSQETPRQKGDLEALTRRVSYGLGTVPSSAKRRMMSLPFAPPFKKVEIRSTV